MLKRASIAATVFVISTLSMTVCADTSGDGSGYVDTHMHLDGVYNQGRTGPRGGPGWSRNDRRRSIRPHIPMGNTPEGRKGPGGRPAGVMTQDYEAAADNLVAQMETYNVTTALIMPPPQYTGQPGAYTYQALAPALSKYPDRLALVAGGGILNPMIEETSASNVSEELKTRFETEAEKLIAAGAKGFGEMTALHLCLSQRHHFIAAPPDHPLFLLLADPAAKHSVPIDMHMEAAPTDIPLPAGLGAACSKNPSTINATIPPFERLLEHNRNARIVWQHIGWDNTGYMTVDLVRRLLSAHSNLYLALRVEDRPLTMAGESMPNRIVDQTGAIKSEWLGLINDYPDRIMIGGDEFVGIPGLTAPKVQSFGETWSMVGQLPSSVAAKVGGENAAKVYNLN